MCLHQKNYKHKAAYFTGNQVKFSTPSESPERKSKCIKRVQQWTLFFILGIKEAISEIWWQIMKGYTKIRQGGQKSRSRFMAPGNQEYPLTRYNCTYVQ